MCILDFAKRPLADATTRCTSTVQKSDAEIRTTMETGYGSASLANPAPSEMLEGS
jgi:hypothetical protein